jgi:tetratricopeptide (TPR) repeat protein
MTSEIKKIVGIVIAVAMLWVAYYGSYMPYTKSVAFISALQQIKSARSLADFENTVGPVLDAPSPIGQEELVRNTASIVLSIVQSNGQQAEITKEVIRFLRQYADPIIAREKGMSFLQNTYVLGLIHTTAYDKTGDKSYLEQAKVYFELSKKLGPNRPQTLYGLFGVYKALGEKEKAIEVGEHIVRLWPTDARTTQFVQQLKGQ